MKNPVLQCLVPGLLLGALGGYFLAGISQSSGAKLLPQNPREAFLSASDDGVNYEKLAHVCLAVSKRNQEHLPAGTLSQDAFVQSNADPAQVQKTKDYLDRLMSNALERGSWSRMISFRARQLMGELPATDAADFANLFSTAVKRGDLKIIPGAWTPEAVN